MPAAIDLTGQKFGFWTLLERRPLSEKKKRHYLCKCECGTVKEVEQSGLVRGASTSCGCRAFPRGTHNETKRGRRSKEYNAWVSMRTRCNNSNFPGFYLYGGRGITVCERWSEFQAFLEDMGRSPPGTSIERIDNEKGYSPANCKWATPKQQTRNTRRSVKIELNGKLQCLKDWAIELGVTSNNLKWRLKNWPKEKALSQSSMGKFGRGA